MKGGLREVVSTGVVFVQQAGIVTALADTAWDTSAILSDTSLFGRVLHTLVGYSDQPSVLHVVVYLVVLIGGLTLSRAFGAQAASRPRVAAAE